MGYIDSCLLPGKLRTSVCITVAATAFLAAGNAYAACTVGGGAPIDGFSVGASVACPTGTVNAGTLPPDGSTITNKNAVGGTTTFTYTRPGGGVGTVQLAGIVNLTAATVVLSDAGQAAAADNAAMVDALFGGGAGAATSTPDAVVFAGPAPEPGSVNALNVELNTAQSELAEDQRQLNAVNSFIKAAVDNQRRPLLLDTEELEDKQQRLDELRNSSENLTVAQQGEALELESDIERLDQEILERQENLAAFVSRFSDRISDLESRIARTEARIQSLTSRIEGAQREGTSPVAPLFGSIASADSRSRFQRAFSTSFRLSEFLLSARNTRLGQTETGDPIFERPARLPSRLDMFANVSYSKVENDANSAGYESKSWQGTVGIDYRVTQPLAIGVFTAFTSNDSQTRTIDSDSDSFSYLVGPFARFNLTRNLTLSSSFSMGKTSTDLRIGTTTSSFDSTQSLATLGLRGTWREGSWTISPQAGISYSTTETDRYTDSAGNVSAERTRRSGAITAGPTISYLHSLFDSGPLISLTPSLGIRGVYNYKHAGDVTFNNGVILTSDDLSASVTPGLGLSFDNGASASFSYTHSGLFADIDGWSVTGGVSAPIEVLIPGLNETASANLQFTAEPQVGPSFVTRFVIPFN